MSPQAREAPSILFIGCGDAARLHSRTLSRHFSGVRRFYSSRTRDRASELARAFGGEVVSGGWREAIRTAPVDAVFVTTPPDAHREITEEALGAGRHAIVEKPAFLDIEGFDAVARAARESGKMVLVAENYFYKPLLRRLRRIIHSGALGQIRLVQINAVKSQPVEGWRADASRAGGGALFEGGIHWVSLMASLGLEIREAHAFPADAPAGHERSAVLVVEYRQGAVGVLNYSWEIPSALRGLRLSRIWGTRRSVLFESNGLFVLVGGRRPKLGFPGVADIRGYRAMLEDFIAALTLDRPAAFTLQDARRDVELLLSAYGRADDPLRP